MTNQNKKKIKECKHKWRVGSYIGYFIGKQIRKKGINIWCENCNKKIKAYYNPSWLKSKSGKKLK